MIQWEKLPNCITFFYGTKIALPDCQTWSSSGRVTITGKVVGESAIGGMGQKVLIKTVKYQKVENEASLKNRLVNFINSLSFYLSQRRTKIFSNLEGKDSSIMQSLLFGQSVLLSPQIKDEFREVGLPNLISVSGYSFSLTIESFFFLQNSIRGRKKGIEQAAVLAIGLYVLVVGYPLALQRVVFSLIIEYLSKRVFYRPILPLYRLLLSSLLLLAFNPYAILDVGLQFSVLASLGMKIFRKPPKIAHLLCVLLPKSIRTNVVQLGWPSISAQVFTFPLVFYYFGQLSLMSPLSNIAVAWVLPIILALGVGYWLVGQFYLPILPFLSPILKAPLSVFMAELHILATAAILFHFQINTTLLALGYCLISFFLFFIFFNHKRHLSQSFHQSLVG